MYADLEPCSQALIRFKGFAAPPISQKRLWPSFSVAPKTFFAAYSNVLLETACRFNASEILFSVQGDFNLLLSNLVAAIPAQSG